MRTKNLTLIIVLMSAALLGLIFVQIYWINNSLKVKEERFNQNVSNALNNVVYRLESSETAEMLSDNFPLKINDNGEGKFFDTTVIEKTIDTATNSQKVKIRVYDKNGNIISKMERHYSETIEFPYEMEYPSNNNDSVENYLNEYDRYFKNFVNEFFTQSQNIFQNNGLDKIFKKGNMLRDVFESRMKTNRAIEERINEKELDKLIKSALGNQGIEIPFQFAVVNQSGQGIMKSENINWNDNLLNTKHKISLFPNDIFNSGNLLLVHFPDEKEHIFRSLWWMVSVSFVFLLIIIFSFAYTLKTIFRQKKLDEMKTDFVNNMTHELKTPIATIAISTEAIREPEISHDESRLKKFVGIIQEENKRLANQVERVLQMAVLDRGDFKLKISEVDIHEVIKNALEKINLQVQQKNGTLHAQLDAENNFIEGDAVHLTNVIFNLLDNANKYSPEKPAITVSTGNSEKGIFISVQDNGIGMNAEAIKNIFEKFYRVPTGNIHDVKGFGLGLAYVKKIVEAHGGEIVVTSEINKGSKFEIFLPFKN